MHMFLYYIYVSIITVFTYKIVICRSGERIISKHFWQNIQISVAVVMTQYDDLKATMTMTR
jgi:hypothetical protein